MTGRVPMNPKTSIRKLTRRFGFRRYSAIELLATLILLFITLPFVDTLRYGESVEVVLMTVVMISAMLAVGGRRKTLSIAVALLLPTLVSKWAHHWFPNFLPASVHVVFTMVFVAFIVANIIRFIMKAPEVNAEVVSAGIVVYLMIGLLWTFGYLLIGDISPDAFSFHTDPSEPQTMTRFNAFYFSFSTLSSNGYGDITPVSKAARMLAVTEAMTGMFYLAILISRLVSLYAPAALEAAEESENES